MQLDRGEVQEARRREATKPGSGGYGCGRKQQQQEQQ